MHFSQVLSALAAAGAAAGHVRPRPAYNDGAELYARDAYAAPDYAGISDSDYARLYARDAGYGEMAQARMREYGGGSPFRDLHHHHDHHHGLGASPERKHEPGSKRKHGKVRPFVSRAPEPSPLRILSAIPSCVPILRVPRKLRVSGGSD